MHTGKINKIIITNICDLEISSVKETEKSVKKRSDLSELRKQNVTGKIENYKQIKYACNELPKGMEAYIIALINGALS